VVLPSTSSANTERIYAAIDNLQVGGKTDGLEGMKIAYTHAEESFIKGGNNRIILATDGKFDVDGRINRMIRMNARENIKLSVFTFGLRTNSAVRENLKALVEFGKGNFAHLKLGEDIHETLLKESKALQR
jgi:Mg-chelatase subunit ChlD